MFIALAAVAAIAVGSAALVLVRSPAPERFALQVARTPGSGALASRCSECEQPGDRFDVSVSGPPGYVYTVRVYRNDRELVAWCADCTALAFTADRLGRYEVYALQLPAAIRCDPPDAGLDRDIAALLRCGSGSGVGSWAEERHYAVIVR